MPDSRKYWHQRRSCLLSCLTSAVHVAKRDGLGKTDSPKIGNWPRSALPPSRVGPNCPKKPLASKIFDSEYLRRMGIEVVVQAVGDW